MGLFVLFVCAACLFGLLASPLVSGEARQPDNLFGKLGKLFSNPFDRLFDNRIIPPCLI